MNPLIIDDMKRIIFNIDERDPQKNKLASLFLFGICTGSRGHSCSGIKMKHFIKHINKSDDL